MNLLSQAKKNLGEEAEKVKLSNLRYWLIRKVMVEEELKEIEKNIREVQEHSLEQLISRGHITSTTMEQFKSRDYASSPETDDRGRRH